MGCGRGLEERSAVLFVSSFRHLTSSLSSHVSRDISECRKLRGCNPETMNPIVTWENKREKGTLKSEYLRRGEADYLKAGSSTTIAHSIYSCIVWPAVASKHAKLSLQYLVCISAVPPLSCGIVLLIWSYIGYVFSAGYPPQPSCTSQCDN